MKALISFSAVALVCGAAAAADLQVMLRNVAPQQGELRLALFDQPQGFPGSPGPQAPTLRVKPTGASVIAVFRDLPPGRYALMVVQDLNDNGRMDYNFLGMPKEAYGASNNRLSAMSAPKFDEALFSVGAQGTVITVELKQP